MSTLVSQCCVVGHTYASCLVGIIVPEFDELRKKLKKRSLDSLDSLTSSVSSVKEKKSSLISFSSSSLNISELTNTEICDIEKIKDIILEDIKSIGKEQNLKGFEQVKDIALISEPFTNENGLLTPSDKNCRPAIKKLYKDLYNELFNKLGQKIKEIQSDLKTLFLSCLNFFILFFMELTIFTSLTLEVKENHLAE